MEWIPSFRRGEEARCLVMIDMAPYAREALPIVQTARSLGMQVVVVTDELNTWARDTLSLSRRHQSGCFPGKHRADDHADERHHP